MQRWAALILLALAIPVLADGPKLEDAQLELTDPKLPLWEMRSLDRRVYVVSLEGAWKKAPRPGAAYNLNVRFGKGETYTHKPIDEKFYKGRLQFMVPEHILIRTQTVKWGKLTFFVTERASINVKKEETISDEVTLEWPLQRPVGTESPPSPGESSRKGITPAPDLPGGD